MLLEVGLRVSDDPIIRGRRVWGDFFKVHPHCGHYHTIPQKLSDFLNSLQKKKQLKDNIELSDI